MMISSHLLRWYWYGKLSLHSAIRRLRSVMKRGIDSISGGSANPSSKRNAGDDGDAEVCFFVRNLQKQSFIIVLFRIRNVPQFPVLF